MSRSLKELGVVKGHWTMQPILFIINVSNLEQCSVYGLGLEKHLSPYPADSLSIASTQHNGRQRSADKEISADTTDKGTPPYHRIPWSVEWWASTSWRKKITGKEIYILDLLSITRQHLLGKQVCWFRERYQSVLSLLSLVLGQIIPLRQTVDSQEVKPIIDISAIKQQTLRSK